MKTGLWKRENPDNQGINITIGGINKNGKDATNEFRYLALKIARELKVPIGLYLRTHEGIPDELWMKAFETNRIVGGGIPVFTTTSVLFRTFWMMG